MKERLLEVVGRLAGSRVLVVGDYMLDRYLWGEAERISPEAPVPVVRIEREESQPGGAGNVVRNLCALGVEPMTVGVVGKDDFGETLRGRLELLGAATDGLIADRDVSTIVKTRVMARGQQMLRLDHEGEPGLPDGVAQEMDARCVEPIGSADGVVFSDYAKGVTSAGLVRHVIEAPGAADKPIFADAKPANFPLYHGITLLTPNESEARTAEAGGSRLETGSNERRTAASGSLEVVGRRLCERMSLEALAITRDARGLLLIEADGSTHDLPGGPTEVVDVTGAGDTVLSVMVAATLAGASMLEAAALGNLAGGLVVQRVGCATVNAEELERSIRAQADYL